MRIIRKSAGLFDKYGKGKVARIDFTYNDRIIVWITYKTKSVAYLWQGY